MAYTNSSLVTYTRISPNRYSPRNHEIDTITIHCVVGQWTAKRTCDYFANSSVKASCNYAVGYDGSIGLCVEEKDGSWCSSSYSNDNRAITIEVASDTKHPYAVTDKALAALIELLADICKRNNIKELKWKGNKSLIGQVDKQNMTVHRWFASKACPGDYLYNKHSYIAEQVNKKLGTSNVTTTPAAPSASTTFKLNDIVNFAGGKQYTSSNATSGSTIKASKAKITNIAKNAKHPYHLRAVNDNGAFIGGVYGWVDASTVSVIGVEVKPEVKVETTTTTKPATTTSTTTSSSSASSSEFKLNEIVNFAGGKQYVSAVATSGSTVKASKAKITNISKNNKHPYHLRAVNDNGAFIGGVYGWVDASTVSKIGTKVETTVKPENSVGIAAGTKLALKNVNLYASSTSSVKASTLTGTYYAWDNAIVNNRIRITNSVANVGKVVTGWINYTDAKKSI